MSILSLSDLEPDDFPSSINDTNPQATNEDISFSPQNCSTPENTSSCSHFSVSAPSGTMGETFMALLRENNTLVKSFSTRLAEME